MILYLKNKNLDFDIDLYKGNPIAILAVLNSKKQPKAVYYFPIQDFAVIGIEKVNFKKRGGQDVIYKVNINPDCYEDFKDFIIEEPDYEYSSMCNHIHGKMCGWFKVKKGEEF